MFNRLHHDERGYSLVTVTLLLPVLAVFLALVLDIGYGYVQRWEMQNAADAAALAGTRALFLGEDAEQAAADYAMRNGAKDVTVTVDPDAKTVRVEAKTNFPTFVASILGYDTLAAENPATGVHGAVSRMTNGVYPIAVDWQDFAEGESYDIYAGGGPGNFGWLTWRGSPCVPTLCTSLTPPGDSETYVNPYNASDHVLDVWDWVQGTPGVSNASCVRARLDHFVSSGEPITIIVWDAVEGSGANLNYRIAGFAEFILENYRLPSQNRITGRFQRMLLATPNIDPTLESYGVHGVKLLE
jgi:Flp pilus assembly protein TadG